MNIYRNSFDPASWPKWLRRRVDSDRPTSADYMVTGLQYKLLGGDPTAAQTEVDLSQLDSRIRCFRAKHFGL